MIENIARIPNYYTTDEVPNNSKLAMEVDKKKPWLSATARVNFPDKAAAILFLSIFLKKAKVWNFTVGVLGWVITVVSIKRTSKYSYPS